MLGERTNYGNGYKSVADFVRGGVLATEHQIVSEHERSKPLEWSFLDLFSTSQTFSSKTDLLNLTCAAPNCINNAPYFAFNKHDTAYGVVQGCCNSWNCPKCGSKRAKHEYGRIVEGCRTLSEQNELWFITITCRGREMSRAEAINGYLEWTNKLLTCWRTYATRHHQKWCYASVTEHQKRGHPHSHILTTWEPPDIVEGLRDRYIVDNSGTKHKDEGKKILSSYVYASCIRAGLGSQYDISRVRSSEAASRYVAKYLFKNTIFTEQWPKGWKRVRYSQSFPKLPERKTDAFILMTREDWNKLGKLASVISVEDYVIGEIVAHHLPDINVILREKTT